MKEISKEIGFNNGIKADILGCLSSLTKEGKLKWTREEPPYYGEEPVWFCETKKLSIRIEPAFNGDPYIRMISKKVKDYYIDIDERVGDFRMRFTEIKSAILAQELRNEFTSIFNIGRETDTEDE